MEHGASYVCIHGGRADGRNGWWVDQYRGLSAFGVTAAFTAFARTERWCRRPRLFGP